MSGIRLTVLILCATPVAILALAQACTPMKSSLGENSLSTIIASTKDICAPEYAPATNLFSKATGATTEPIAPFSQKKVHLSGSQFQKANVSLINQNVIVVIDLSCTPDSLNSLSAKVFKQASNLNTELQHTAISYNVTEALTASEFEAAANEDPCVLGVTLPGTIKTSSLDAPVTTDPNIAQQQHLIATNYLHAYQYLALTQNSSSPKVKVGFLDTGVDCSHPDLMANLVDGCGYNALSPSSLPSDNDGHGTNTAGIVAAVSNNAVGVLGLTGNAVTIYAIKVIDVETGNVQAAYNGIQYAIQNNINVLNISLQSDSQLTLLEQGVSEAVAAGIVVVMAAGNHGQELVNSIYVSPGAIGKNLQGAITVGSTDAISGTLSYFSNYGDYVEIAAPGAYDSSLPSSTGGIYSTYKGSAYKRMMGTSQAAPIIAGAAGLVIQFLKSRNIGYTPANIEKIVLNSTDTPTNVSISGHRVINFSKLTRNAYAFAGVSLCN
jgi:hypothetical protein